MSLQRTILLVSPTPAVEKAVSSAIRHLGHHVLVTKTFEAAKRYLSSGPHLLVTELKLGAYNGLHLALRAAGAIPAIVIAERSFEHVIEEVGAVWMSPDAVAGEDLPMTAIRLLQGVGAGQAAPEWFDADAATSTALSDWEPARSGIRH